MLFGALTVALVQIAVGCGCFALARSRGGTGIGLSIALGVASFFAFGFCAGGPVPFFLWLALFAVGVVCLLGHLRTRSFLAGSALVTVVVFALTGMLAQPDYARLRRVYPFESMAERLAHEALRSGQLERKAATLPEQTRLRLTQLENRYETDRLRNNILEGRLRAESLKLVHASQVQQFINSQGFGVGRRLTPSVRYLKWDNRIKRPPVPQPAAPSEGLYPSTAGTLAPGNPARTKPPSDTELDTLHQEAQLDFVNQAGFGYVKDRDHVAGFESHGFFRTPELRRPRNHVRWLTHRVELVSILLHANPMVYVSENLPNMQQLDDVEVRPLDAFESNALDALRQGEDLVWRASTNRLRMLGSLRAARQCTQCHMVPRGTLLGAFSYEFHRDPPLPVEERKESADVF